MRKLRHRKVTELLRGKQVCEVRVSGCRAHTLNHVVLSTPDWARIREARVLSPAAIWEHHYLECVSVTRKQVTAGVYFKNRPQDLFIDQHSQVQAPTPCVSAGLCLFQSPASPVALYPPAPLCSQDRGGSWGLVMCVTSSKSPSWAHIFHHSAGAESMVPKSVVRRCGARPWPGLSSPLASWVTSGKSSLSLAPLYGKKQECYFFQSYED